jgi:hypothetical protein
VLPDIISCYQSAFIPGRLIIDNVITAYETMHSMQTRMWSKVRFMGIKLDMSIEQGDVQIYLLARARIVCSIVHASARSNSQGSVCKDKKINFYLNKFCLNLEPKIWNFCQTKQ